MSDSQREYLSVSNTPGVEPIVGKPIGQAPTSLVIQDIITGSGDEVVATSTLTVHYQLISWASGEILQSSWKSPRTSQGQRCEFGSAEDFRRMVNERAHSQASEK